MKNETTISNFFYPKSLILIGASSKPKSIGYEVLKMILHYGYKGKVFIVNPGNDEILGIKCNKTIEEISEKIDLAIVLVPKRYVFETVKNCNACNIKNIIIITAGFRETGDEGASAEKEILEFAKKNDIRLVGPNCMGLINSHPDVKLNATFAAELPEYAKVGFLSQSGAIGAALLNTISETNYCFNQFISIGNKADINENDLMKYWHSSTDISVITMYLESFSGGKEFFKIASKVTKDKPVLVLKAAKGEQAMKAASSHTGALASRDNVVNVSLREAGVTRVDTVEELFETAKAFEKLSFPRGNRVAVITNAGGPGILCTDEIEKNGLLLAKFSDDTLQKLKAILSEDASKANPVDMLPAANEEMYKQVAEIILADKNVDAVIVIFVEPVTMAPFDIIFNSAKIQKESDKPVLITVFPLPKFWNDWKEKGIKDSLLYKTAELPPRIIRHLLDRQIYLKQKKVKIKTDKTINKKELEKARKIISNSKTEFLLPEECEKILKLLKVPFIKNSIAGNWKELKKKSETLNYPLVLKIKSKEITHKSDVGGVIVDIKDKKELKKAYQGIKENLKQKNLLEKIEGYEIQEFLKEGTEVLIGGFRDDNFGPVMMFGAGGKLVEVVRDSNIALAPVNKASGLNLIKSSVISRVLSGYRDIKPVDIDKIAEIIIKMSVLLNEVSEIKEFDINPLIVNSDWNKSKVVDIRIKKQISEIV